MYRQPGQLCAYFTHAEQGCLLLCPVSLQVGSIEFVPVSSQCPVAQIAGAWGLPPICVVLGASYFERLMMRHNWMGATAADLGFFRHNGQDWVSAG